MPIQTRTITATISDLNGPRLPGARVVIELKGLGNSPQGAVAPGRIEQLTDTEGVAEFQLWQNSLEYSDTYYEISSWHPITGKPIHQREFFVVGDSNADVKDLINTAPQQIDPTAALLTQVTLARAGAENAATEAKGHRDTAQGYAQDALDAAGVSTDQADISIAQAGIATAQAGVAVAKASEAAASANAAMENKEEAEQYKNDAEAARNVAQAHAQAAATSATTSQDKAELAESFANSASSHAAAAESAVGIIGDYVGDALAHRQAAETAASTAITKAGETSSLALSAADSASNAGQHKVDAQDARDQAIAAKNAAETAAEQAGKSAYDLAVEEGFSGTLGEWLASLQGEDGEDGTDGTDGDDGLPGLSAYEVALGNGFTGTEQEWLESLKGEKGEPGDGSGDGTVTTVGVAVPQGFEVTGSPVTEAGTITITFAAGYSLPTTAKQAQWDAAYGWGNHAGLYRSNSWVPSWSEVSGKPATMPPSSHLHSVDDLTAAGTPSNTTFLRGDGTWATPAVGGTVSSVGVSVPTGFSVAGSPITTSGTIALSFATGYSLPTTTKQGQWDTAYGWGDHAGLYRSSSWSPSWDEVSDKPAAFTPAGHSHSVTDLSASGTPSSTTFLRGDGTWATPSISVTWDGVSDKPSTFTPSSHTLGSHSDVSIGTRSTGQLLRWNGSSWANWSPNYLTSYSESDPTVPSHVKSITSTNISNWNSAYGWGNHASAGYALDSSVVKTTGNQSISGIKTYTGDLRISNSAEAKLELVRGSRTVRVTSTSTPNVGFYDASANKWLLRIDGSDTIHGLNDISGFSDPKLKKDMKPLANAKAALLKMSGYEFRWIKNPDKLHSGLNAAEVEEAHPTAVHYDEDGIRSVAAMSMIGLLVQGYKELAEEVEELSEKLKVLKGDK